MLKLIKIPLKITHGNLAVAAGKIPFAVKRTCFIYGVPEGVTRGNHAHKKLRSVLFCVSGSVKIKVDDGKKQQSVVLDKPNLGVLLEPHFWRQMSEFKKGTVLVVLMSTNYDPDDYIKDYAKFKNRS
jgi:dTDP-4-dehydrorhamnose 3,5-epimerase-like enzyme